LEESENACAGFFACPSEEKACMGLETRDSCNGIPEKSGGTFFRIHLWVSNCLKYVDEKPKSGLNKYY
jgi:hypothetical protein